VNIRIAIAAAVICSFCATACNHQDTAAREEWPRTTQARLTVTKVWKKCDTPHCGAPPAAAQPCDVEVPTPAAAARMLATQPHCVDHAITALERFAPDDAMAMVDLAAAYYMRAQKNDRAADLLQAWEASEQALAAAPTSLPQRFNRALIQESAGLYDAAIASWDTYLQMDPSSEWAQEAESHRTRLAREQNRDAAAAWAKAQQKLPAALNVRNAALIRRLIERYPGHSYRYLETTLLRDYAQSPDDAKLRAVKTFAQALFERTGDRYAVDLAEGIETHFEDVQAGSAAFAQRDFHTALSAFTRAQSPLRHRMAIGAARIVLAGKKEDALALLDAPLQEARDRGYIDLLANIQSMRGLILTLQSDYPGALQAYDDALAHYARLRDRDGIGRTNLRRSGILLVLGRADEAWRAALQGMRDFSSIIDAQERHLLLGALADAAARLGHARFALVNRDAAVRLSQEQLVAVDPENLHQIGQAQANLAAARRARARTLVELNRLEAAIADLNEAFRLARLQRDQNIGRIIESRIDEIRGQTHLLRKDIAAAIEAFTRALNRSEASEYRTYRAGLLAQRAAACRRAGRHNEAERDLRVALDELRIEESRILERRKRGENDDVWSPYFSRFRETYELLIRHLIERQQPAEAFAIAERARAFEPLNLVLQLQDVPETFRTATRGGTAADRATIQASLPPGTLILEYLVLGDRTYTWLISRERFDLLMLPVRRQEIQRWQQALQTAIRDRDHRAFQSVVSDAYAALVQQPLARAQQQPRKLVFIPDGPMHGLPLSALYNRNTRRHLLQDFPVAIAGSATLYLFSLEQDRRRTSEKANILVIGDPEFDQHLVFARDLRPLRYARAEARELHALYGSRAELLIGAEATVPAMMDGARHSTVVHVGAHGLVNAQAPSQSLLLLAPSKQHSGALNATELLTRFKTDETKLVVLAACSSAGGLPVGPEGVAPLVRPLIAAGVPAVIGSLWEVDDATAAALFVSFHRHYEKGEDAATALQRAQLELLGSEQPGLRSVFTWAPFQVIGHASSPFGPRQQNGGTLNGIRSQDSLQRPDGLYAE
jgi:CHAT domain-containing protein